LFLGKGNDFAVVTILVLISVSLTFNLPNIHAADKDVTISENNNPGDISPLQRLPATNVKIVDAFYEPIEIIHVGEFIMISADLINGIDEKHNFVYMVQIQDMQGHTVHLSWMTGSIFPEQTISTAVSWLPTIPSDYIVQTFVWNSFDGPTPLSLPTEISFTVLP